MQRALIIVKFAYFKSISIDFSWNPVDFKMEQDLIIHWRNQNYDILKKNCKSKGILFEDPEFPASNDLLDDKNSKGNQTWLNTKKNTSKNKLPLRLSSMVTTLWDLWENWRIPWTKNGCGRCGSIWYKSRHPWKLLACR